MMFSFFNARVIANSFVKNAYRDKFRVIHLYRHTGIPSRITAGSRRVRVFQRDFYATATNTRLI